MHCAACREHTMEDRQLCNSCLLKRWGQEPHVDYFLPDCLMQIVAQYLNPHVLLAQCCKNNLLTQFRYVVYVFGTKVVAKSDCLCISLRTWNFNIAQYIMDYFGNSHSINKQTAIRLVVLNHQWHLIPRFSTSDVLYAMQTIAFHKEPDGSLLLEMFLKTTPSICLPISTLEQRQFVVGLCALKSTRIIEILIARGTFHCQVETMSFLHLLIFQEFCLQVWTLIWASQTPRLCQRDFPAFFELLFKTAYERKSFTAFDFFASLPDFQITSNMCFIPHIWRSQKMQQWIMRHRRLQSQLFLQDDVWLISSANELIARICNNVNPCDVYQRLTTGKLVVRLTEKNPDLLNLLTQTFPTLSTIVPQPLHIKQTNGC